MPVQTDHGIGLSWPKDFEAILPLIRREWGIGDQLYLNRMLGKGRSGALVYIADVSSSDFRGQAILKLDHVSHSSEQEKLEGELHAQAIKDAPEFAAAHLPRIIHSLHNDDVLAILSTIAGRGLEYADPLYDLSHDRQLEVIRHVSLGLLEEWNADYGLSSGLQMPQALLRSWLDHRIDPALGGRIHSFLQDDCQISPDTPTILYNGHWYPNPLAFYDQAIETPERLQLRAVMGHVHNDLHGDNLLVGQREQQEPHADPSYYLIDLAMYQSKQYLLFDHAYFEFTTLLANRGQGSAEDWEAVVAQVRRYRSDVETELRTDDFGLIEIIETVRKGVADWVNSHEADRLSFMESQQILARVAVGLSFSHKRLSNDQRKKAFYFAAVNLKDYLRLNRVDWPKHGQELFIERTDAGQAPVHVSAKQTTIPIPSGARPAPAPPVPAPSRNRFTLISLVVAAIAGLALFAAVLGLRDGQLPGPAEVVSTDDALKALSADNGDISQRPSVAVMPFTNANQTFGDNFADGLTIEIINVLARTGQVRIPGFASAMKFKNEDADVRQVGEALNVEYVVEGTVEQINDQVRIAVNVYDAATGNLVWNGLFNESKERVFKAQEDLAKAIGNALSVTLDVSSETLAANRTQDSEAYHAYVRGISLLEQRGDALVRSIALLERAVELEPDFAAAWAALSIAYNIAPTYLRVAGGEQVRPSVYYRRSKNAALKALDLDPELSEVQHAAGNMYQRDRQWIQSERAYQRALELDPANHRAMQDYGGLLQTVGKPKQALELLERAKALDPNNDLYRLMLARLSFQLSETEEEVAEIEAIFRETPSLRELAFRPIIAAGARVGELDKARDLIVSCVTCTQRFRSRALSLINSAGVVPAKEIYEAYRDEPYLTYMFLYRYGDLDVALDLFEYNALESNYRLQYFTVPWGMINIVGSADRFDEIVEDMGLVTYWRRNGWSPMCEPTPTGPRCQRK